MRRCLRESLIVLATLKLHAAVRLQSTPAFGMSQPAFGSTTFGASSAASPFGTPAPAFGQGGAFGGTSFGSSTPAFGASSAAAPFGSSTPAFGAGGAFGGGFGATSTPAFGQSSAGAFGGGMNFMPLIQAQHVAAVIVSSTLSVSFVSARLPAFPSCQLRAACSSFSLDATPPPRLELDVLQGRMDIEILCYHKGFLGILNLNTRCQLGAHRACFVIHCGFPLLPPAVRHHLVD